MNTPMYVSIPMHLYLSFYMPLYPHMSVHLCPVKYTIVLYFSIWVYEKTHSYIYSICISIPASNVYAYLQGIVGIVLI